MSHWIFPADWSQFDVLTAFAALHELDWRKNCSAQVGDLVFIYLGKPVQKIVLKAVVVKDDLLRVGIDDKPYYKGKPSKYNENVGGTLRFLRLEVASSFVHLDKQMSLSTLRSHCLAKNIQGPQLLENNKQLFKYILAVTDTKQG